MLYVFAKVIYNHIKGRAQPTFVRCSKTFGEDMYILIRLLILMIFGSALAHADAPPMSGYMDCARAIGLAIDDKFAVIPGEGSGNKGLFVYTDRSAFFLPLGAPRFEDSQAHEFFLHLRSLEYGLRDLTKSLKDIHDPKKLLGSFFTDFVEEFLVADYKTLHTQENPFRFRTEIIRIVRELRFSTIAKETLPTAYLRLQIVKSRGDALGRVDQDFQVLQRVFEEADNHLARIDTYRSSLERRVAESIRYLDKTQPGMAARLAHLTNRLAVVDESMLCILPPLHRMARILPLSPKSPRPPSSTKQPPDLSNSVQNFPD